MAWDGKMSAEMGTIHSQMLNEDVVQELRDGMPTVFASFRHLYESILSLTILQGFWDYKIYSQRNQIQRVTGAWHNGSQG